MAAGENAGEKRGREWKMDEARSLQGPNALGGSAPDRPLSVSELTSTYQ